MEVTILNKAFVPYIAAAEIDKAVQQLAATINADYAGKRPLFIGILNGSFMFAADLFRHITIEAEISFIKLASYKGTTSSGNVITAIGLEENLEDRHVIVVEDIVDTGNTLFGFLKELAVRRPASVEIASFLNKPEARKYDVSPKYCCFQIENKFVVGYGLDYDGYGRNLPELYVAAE
ncbi:MAG: hypoxanthine phosphoribosyltransferase [Chitinophagia bacterium]|nr:hypoxanthine phosphoribosyltransferase [Chitinophagia bacterium]